MAFKTVTINPTVSLVAYAAEDLIGGKITLTGFLGVNYGAKLHSLVLIDQAAQNAAMDFLLFDADPATTTFTDNAALDVADAEILNLVAIVPLATTDYKALADNSIAMVRLSPAISIVAASSTLYGALVSRGTPTYAAATDLRLKLTVEV